MLLFFLLLLLLFWIFFLCYIMMMDFHILGLDMGTFRLEPLLLSLLLHCYQNKSYKLPTCCLLSNRRMQCLKTQCQQMHVRHVRRLLNKYAVNSAFVKNAVRREFQSSIRLRFIRWGMSVHPWVRRADSEADKVRSAHRNSASVRSYTD